MHKTTKLLSVILAAAMVVCMLAPLSAFADSNVAAIGDAQYATLEAAVDAAQAGDTVKLLADITKGESYSVPVWGKGFNIDLNGYTFTTNSNQSITLNNNGYKATAICFGDETNVPNPTRDISLSNGTIRTAYGAGVYADGQNLTMTLSDLDVKQNYPANVQSTDEYSTAVRLTGNATVIIESGRYEGKHAIVVSNSGGSVIVNGGTFVGDIFIAPTTSAGAVKSVTIYGGTFDHDPTAYVAEGYKAVNNGNGTWTVMSKYVAQVGETKYETLAGAIAAANAMSNATVTLLNDYDMEANEPGYGWTTSYVAAGETTPRNNMIGISGTGLTLDLNGYTLSNLYNNTFEVTGENITIENGTMTIGTLYAGSYSSKGKVTLYSTPRPCSYVIKTEGATNFTINDLTTTGGINIANATTATVNGLNFSGASYYAICSQEHSDVTINGGTFDKATAGYANCLVWVEPDSVMNITGGTFLKGGAVFCDIDYESIVPVITGGTFDFDPTNFGLAEGYTAVNNGNGTWTVKSAYAAQIGETKYETLDAAADAANPGDTIVLLDDITYGTDRVVPVWEKGFNIDLNGYTLTTNSNQSITLSNNGYKATAICFGIDAPHGDSYVTNGTIRTAYGAGIYAAGDVTMTLSGLDVKQNYPTNVQTTDEYSSAIRLTSKSVVIVEDGSYSGKNAIAVSNSGGSVIVNGGNFTGDIFFSNSYSKGLTAADKVITINGGTFTDAHFVNPNKGTLTIYGGTFDNDPTAYVADGYEAVNNGDGTWTVGEVKAGELTKTVTQGDADATYTLTKQVVDENDNVIDEGTNRTVNVKVVSEDDTSVNTAEEIISNLSMDKVLDSVVAKIDDAVDTVKVEIQVASDDTNVDDVNNTITYEVHPEATIYVNDQPAGTVTISNDALAENAVFTIKLAVPNNIAAASANGNITVTHISADYGTETAIYPLQGEENNYYVQFDVTHFSEFVVEAGGSLFTGHSVTLNGYINLNFYLNLAESQVTTGAGTVVNFNWAQDSASSYTVTTADYVDGKGYRATVQLPAAEMTYGITATVVINGVEQSETNTYSVRQYADELLAITSDTKLINLVNAMLDYGAKAQIAFNSNADNLANADIDYTMPDVTREDLLNLIDQAIIDANNGARATVVRDVAEAIGAEAYYSSSLIYLSGCTLRHYFYGTDLDVTKFTGVKSDHYYYIDKENIAAADLDKLQPFTVGDLTFHYSALDFVKAIIYNYTAGSNYDLAAATYWYNQAANAYFE